MALGDLRDGCWWGDIVMSVVKELRMLGASLSGFNLRCAYEHCLAMELKLKKADKALVLARSARERAELALEEAESYEEQMDDARYEAGSVSDKAEEALSLLKELSGHKDVLAVMCDVVGVRMLVELGIRDGGLAGVVEGILRDVGFEGSWKSRGEDGRLIIGFELDIGK